MKKYGLFFPRLIVVLLLVFNITLLSVSAVSNLDNEIVPNEQNELQPMRAAGCSEYYYADRGMDMDAVAEENGWTMIGNKIYEDGVEIGRYDDGSNGQDPHFHLYEDEGVHYILA